MLMSGLDICICTYRRNSLIRTLCSISALDPVIGVSLNIIVADNDEEPSAQAIISSFLNMHTLSIKYLHAPAHNISVARNACLSASTSDWIAFIDDDEILSPQWLEAVVRGLHLLGSDAVFGPVKALYRSAAPHWVQNEDYHSTSIVRRKGRIETGYTCNVVFNKTHPGFIDNAFDPSLGHSGGEDTDFFHRAFKAGAEFGYIEDAMIFEPVSKERESLVWLCLRRFRSGQTFATSCANQHLMLGIGLPIAKLATCILMVIFSICRPRRLRYWLLRGAVHCGAVSAAMGIRGLKLYRTT